MSFNDLRKGYADGLNKKGTEKQPEMTAEEKELLEIKDLDVLSLRAKMRIAYLRSKLELEKQLKKEELDSLDD